MNKITRSIFSILTMALTSLTLQSPSYADEFQAVTSDLSPFTISAEEKDPGFLHEVVMEMQKRSDVKIKVNYFPWKRAQSTAETEPNTLIFGLTRAPEREAKYSWLVKLLDTEDAFVSNQVEVNSYEEAQKLEHIAARNGTPFVQRLIDKGFKNLIQVESEKQNVDLLNIKRAQAWITLKHRAAYMWKKGGYDIKDLKIGKGLNPVKLYLAGHPSLANNKELQEKLQKAYDSLIADGTYNTLHMKYFGFPAEKQS